MSAEARPAPTPFDPGSAALPPALARAILETDSPILLLVAPDTGDPAARAAIGLAEARAGAGEPTILADASAKEPRLHKILDVDNLEGLADVFLFGASLDRVRVRPETHGFDFIPIGAYVPDPSAVLDSARWDRIAASVRSEGARLLVFVPASSPGLGILSARAGQAVLIGDSGSVERMAAGLDPSCEVLAVVEPASTVAPDALAAGAASSLDRESATTLDEPELTEPVIFRSDRKSRRAISPVLLLLLVAALLAAAWFVYQEYFPATTPESGAEPARQAQVERARGAPVETPIPISVAVEAHQDLESATERIEALRQAEPDIGFYLAPVSVRDVLYYRLLAGPVSDRAAGERLMERLVEGQYKTATDMWAVRPTEQAFHLGEFDTEEAARARVRELAALTVEDVDEEGNAVERRVPIPAYVVPIRYDRGSQRYRVYGGAYESEAEASVMAEMLTEAGLEPRLVARTGEPIAEDA